MSEATKATKTAKLEFDGKVYELPMFMGTENEWAIDIQKLRADTGGVITFDDGYGNTGSCVSDITYIDGEAGILRHRGYAIEELAAKSTFLETAYLTIYGQLPTADALATFKSNLREKSLLQEGLRHTYDGFPRDAHPMAVLSAMLDSLGCYYPDATTNDHQHDLEHFDQAVALLISKVRMIAAMTYRNARGLPWAYARPDLRYAANFLHVMFSRPYDDYEPPKEMVEALDLIFLLHTDHEQNCSTSTVRMVASSGANLFASVSSGVSALWGPLHGGANTAVLKQLEAIHAEGDDGSKYIEMAKKGERRLMGFGHRVYKNFDPRAKILKEAADRILNNLGIQDPLLDIAKNLEEAALKDEYFVQRKLYPNVDFYSGIILRACGIPVELFTVIFAIGRMPGWIAHWHEVASAPKQKIHRPRQIYTGATLRNYVPVEQR